jgi:oxygen-dependent protoporphyrinogen oxidase
VIEGSTEEVDVVIVGAGLAGLASAWALRDRKIVVLEAADRPGGRLRSVPAGEYWLNMGAHMFGGPESRVGALVDAMKLETRPIVGRLIGISYKGARLLRTRTEAYPLLLPLNLRQRLAFVRAGLRLRTGAARLSSLMRGLALADAERRTDSLLQFENQRTLTALLGRLEPGIAALIRAFTERSGADPDQMSAGHGLRSLANVWSNDAPGRNLIGGSAKLPEALAASLGSRVRLGHEVVEVRQDADRVRVRYVAGGAQREITANAAIIASPAFVAHRIVPDLPAGTRNALSQIRYGSFLTVAVRTTESSPMPWDNVYAISTPARSFSVLFNMATTLRTGPRQPGGSIMLFRGARGAAEMMANSDDTIARMFVDDLMREFPEAQGIVRDVIVQRWTAGAPFATPGRAELQRDLREPLGRVFLAGDYLDFPNMESALASADTAVTGATRLLDAPR